ncbi:hypothetical protein [Hyphomicrobium sp.]|uniref:hypothetical protein n=1 Tax=Hyphomicrobium sp. TaxID=82 RepID=UPI0035628323
MKKLFASLLGLAALLAVDLSYAVTPASALGGCGPNRHRSSVTGRCIWGGQNQAWCVRHTGYRAVRTPSGRLVCVR